MRVYLESLGCRLNQSEIESLASRFVECGQSVVQDPAQADLCVVNTCAVTAAAERKSRQRTRKLNRANPSASIALIGCYATMAPGVCAGLAGVAWTVPNAQKNRTVEIVAPLSSEVVRSSTSPVNCPQKGDRGPSYRTRAFVKIQDGCDNHCTFCIVRSLRGSARSRPMAEVVEEALSLAASGIQEIVLTGVNLGCYGRDLGLADGLQLLVTAILADTDLPRLRLSSLEPWHLHDSLFSLWENPRLCRQLHVPLQSGCDQILHRMGRRPSTSAFARLVEAARGAIPDLAVTTDVIVGFPGEDDAAFHASYDFVTAMEFARLHVFSYSPRPGTPAADFPDQVDRRVLNGRARVMRKLGKELAHRFAERFVGREMGVLWERRRFPGAWRGITDNYLRVVTQGEANLRNRLTLTRLVAVGGGVLNGKIVRE